MICDLIHYFILIFIILIPFSPIQILKYIFIFPLFLPLLWLIFGDCPLNLFNKNYNKNNKFQYQLLKKIFPTISNDTANSLITFGLLLIVIISSIRIIHFYKGYQNFSLGLK